MLHNSILEAVMQRNRKSESSEEQARESSFCSLNASSVSGAFSTVNGTCINADEHFTVTYEATDVVLTAVTGACS
jgi:hypothetical protein